MILPNAETRRFRWVFFAVIVAVLVALAAPAFALWRSMPWGLVTIWWDLPAAKAVPFQSISIEVEVLKDPPNDVHLYLAPLGQGWLGGTPFYGGIQVGAPLPKGGRGRIALFSRWNERSQEAIRTAPGGFSESAGHEGDFIGVRQEVPWHVGRYTFKLAVTDHDAANTWVAMTVTEAASGRTWPVGALRFSGVAPVLKPSLASFVEVFGPAVSPEAIPETNIVFGEIKINGVPTIPTGAKALFAPNIPPFARAVVVRSGAVAVATGRLQDRTGMAVDTQGNRIQKLSW